MERGQVHKAAALYLNEKGHTLCHQASGAATEIQNHRLAPELIHVFPNKVEGWQCCQIIHIAVRPVLLPAKLSYLTGLFMYLLLFSSHPALGL